MPVPWLQLVDAALGIANFARGRKAPEPPTEAGQQIDAATRAPAGLEARLAGVVVAALKEAFDRDSRRLELEREQLAAERQRAERLLRLELHRQAGDREIGRLRLLAGVAGTAWIGSLLLLSRVTGGGMGARVTLGFGWLLLLGAIAASFTAQSRVASVTEALTSGDDDRRSIESGAGAAALWLMLCGLVLVGLAALLA
ncbi:MAG TPA: hypothetical protein VGP77_05670 [Vicinamibacterales bacterium]|nr:hypothetical protein [Vicinamibacterales bacterium]